MVLRIWRGYTTIDQADSYEKLLKTEIFPGIERKNLEGYKGIELLRRNLGKQVEFMTIMRFGDIDSIKKFVGEDYESVYVPNEAQKIRTRFDKKSVHFELRHMLQYSEH